MSCLFLKNKGEAIGLEQIFGSYVQAFVLHSSLQPDVCMSRFRVYPAGHVGDAVHVAFP